MKKNKTFIVTILLVIVCLVFTGCGAEPKSAYDIAVDNGFIGSQKEWLDSLKGSNGTNGADGQNIDYQALYDTAVENGFNGTFMDFVGEYLDKVIGNNELDNVLAVNRAMMSSVFVVCEMPLTNFAGQLIGYSYSRGSGVIINDNKSNGDCTIVTNHHVVFDSNNAKLCAKAHIYLYGMSIPSEANAQFKYAPIEGDVLGSSNTNDIAVISIKNNDLYKKSACMPVKIADSNEILLGQNALAVGNPQAKGFSVTSGIVSKENEYIIMPDLADNSKRNIFRVMRIDTAINGGNSGGGLFNSNGELIGIVNAKFVDKSIENIAYAIPSNVAMGVAYNIINNNGNFNRKILGIQTIQEFVSSELNPHGIVNVKNKVLVKEVQVGSNAEGKIAVNDEIIKIKLISGKNQQVIKETDVKENYYITDLMLYASKGDTVELNIIRNSQPQTISIEVK